MASDRPDHDFDESVAETSLHLAEFDDADAAQFELYVKSGPRMHCVGRGDSIPDVLGQAADSLRPAEELDE